MKQSVAKLLLMASFVFTPLPASAAKGRCQVPEEPATIVCEVGAGFLCLNTPPGGVAQEFMTLRGTVDRQRSAVASLSISAQHDYTKEIIDIETSDPATENCWDDDVENLFCLQSDGKFSARVPLPTPGPYTIAVTASRLSGESVRRSIATSRVVPISLTEGDISFEPDIRGNAVVENDVVRVIVDTLGDCTFCDFIGASTQGVRVTVKNRIRAKNGSEKSVSCSTTIEQEGQGRFVVGIPTEAGRNRLEVKVCNAATYESCPTFEVAFGGDGAGRGMTILTPDPEQSLFPSSHFQKIPFTFRLTPPSEADCVKVLHNRKETCVAPGADRLYRLDLISETGINIVAVDDGERFHTWSFGWGEVVSEPEPTLSLSLQSRFFTDIVQPMATNFLSSDQFSQLLDSLLRERGAPSASEESDPLSGEIREALEKALPKCFQNGAAGGFGMELRERPKFGEARVEGMMLQQGKIDMTLALKNLDARVNLTRQGKPSLPLKLLFKELNIDLRLEHQRSSQGSDLLVVTSRHRDCDRMSRTVCENVPMPLMPHRFKGGATKYGHFVACDVEAATPEVLEVCKSINTIDAQTGIFSLKVLKAVNNALVCNGSSALAAVMHRNRPVEAKFGAFQFAGRPSWKEGVLISSQGIAMAPTFLFDGGQKKGGMIRSSTSPLRSLQVGEGMMRIELPVDTLNAFLFLSPFQFDLHEAFFEKQGFRFEEECDIGKLEEGMSPFCSIRPRVSELLGTPLVSYGYLAADQPLLWRIRSHPELAPRVELLSEERGIELQIGGLEFSFYALEADGRARRDETGVRPIKKDADGEPIFHPLVEGLEGEEGAHIITFQLSTLLALEIGKIENNPLNPDEFVVTVRPLAEDSHFFMSPKAGSNSTTIPDELLIETLRGKIQLELSELSQKGVPITFPKELAREDKTDLFPLLGLKKIDFRPDGLALEINPATNRMALRIDPLVFQLLQRGGTPVEYHLP